MQAASNNSRRVFEAVYGSVKEQALALVSKYLATPNGDGETALPCTRLLRRSVLAHVNSTIRWYDSTECTIDLRKDLIPTDLLTGNCSKKSDILRVLLCPRALQDRAANCLGHGTREGCAACKDGARLARDEAREEKIWGARDDPLKTITSHSYRNETDHADNELHKHVEHPATNLYKYVATVQKYAKHWLTLKKQKEAHAQLEKNFMPWQMLFDYDFGTWSVEVCCSVVFLLTLPFLLCVLFVCGGL
jgi:hypothetical protein